MRSRSETVIVITTKTWDFLSYQPIRAAERLGFHVVHMTITNPAEFACVGRTLHTIKPRQVLFVSVHAIAAAGGAREIEDFADKVPYIVTVWNVDCVPLIYRDLPQHPKIRMVHNAPSDCNFWNDHVFSSEALDFTYGAGDFGAPDLDSCVVPMHERSITLLVPINLRWASRTLDEVTAEVATRAPLIYRAFEHFYEELRTIPSCNIPAHIVSSGYCRPEHVVQVCRFVVYATQLWRRNWLVQELLQYPVVIDSNEISPALLKGRRIRAQLLKNNDPALTQARMTDARAVLNTSSPCDLLHDRVLNSIALGALAFSDYNAIFPAVFADKGLIYYDFQIDSIGAAIERLLGEPSGLQFQQDAGMRRLLDIRDRLGFDRLWLTETSMGRNQEARDRGFTLDEQLLANVEA
jgi:hypothetical protein